LAGVDDKAVEGPGAALGLGCVWATTIGHGGVLSGELEHCDEAVILPGPLPEGE